MDETEADELMAECEEQSLPASARRAVQTRGRILDAAEYLFGHASPDTVSLRDISSRAAVALGLVHHHFGNKESLIEQVVARRSRDLCEMRQQRLAELKARGDFTLEQLIDAFFGPLFAKLSEDDEGWRAYVVLLSQVGFTDRWKQLRPRYFDPTLRLFLEALAGKLPGASPAQLSYGFNFALMCMINTITQSANLIEAVHGGDDTPATASWSAEIYPHLLRFACAGLRGIGG
jgi:AcrR family transcriptional regulator